MQCECHADIRDYAKDMQENVSMGNSALLSDLSRWPNEAATWLWNLPNYHKCVVAFNAFGRTVRNIDVNIAKVAFVCYISRICRMGL